MFTFVLIASALTCSLGAVLPDVPRFDGRIVGGDSATIEDAPYQVSLMVDFDGTGAFRHYCGGSIIKPNVILSAAHCVDDIDSTKMKIRAGSSSMSSGGTIASVSKLIPHEYYNSRLDYDFSLIFLEEDLLLDTVTIAKIELPFENQNILAGSQALVTGWGSTSEGGPGSSTLRKVTIPIVDQGVCEALYSSVNPVTPRMICAGLIGPGGQDACQGDSGGPMAVGGVLVGVTSWGFGCARPNYPGVWARVPAAITWISETIEDNTAIRN